MKGEGQKGEGRGEKRDRVASWLWGMDASATDKY